MADERERPDPAEPPAPAAAVAPAAPTLAALESAAVALAEEAGRLALDYYRRALTVEYKDRARRDPVTAADRAVERLIADAVNARFPDHAVLGEEGGEEGAPGRAAADYLWVVDPVDGTSNFVNRLPLFAVSVAVLRERRPVAGAIFLPGPAELGGGVYHARQGGGAFVGERRLLAAGPAPEPSRLVSLPGFPSRQFRLGGRLARDPGDVRTLGSAAYELALVAAGVCQYGLYRSLRIWDVAAGVLLVTEAGGAAYRWRGWLRGWGALEGFAARRPTPEDPTGLRGWSEPLLVGGADVVRAVARDVRPTWWRW